MTQTHIDTGEMYNCYGCISSRVLKTGIGCTNQQTYADYTFVTMTEPGGKRRFRSVTPVYIWQSIAYLEAGQRSRIKPTDVTYVFVPKPLHGTHDHPPPTKEQQKRQRLRNALIVEELKNLNIDRAKAGKPLYPESCNTAKWPRLEGRRPSLKTLMDKRDLTIEQLYIVHNIT